MQTDTKMNQSAGRYIADWAMSLFDGWSVGFGADAELGVPTQAVRHNNNDTNLCNNHDTNNSNSNSKNNRNSKSNSNRNSTISNSNSNSSDAINSIIIISSSSSTTSHNNINNSDNNDNTHNDDNYSNNSNHSDHNVPTKAVRLRPDQLLDGLENERPADPSRALVCYSMV